MTERIRCGLDGVGKLEINPWCEDVKDYPLGFWGRVINSTSSTKALLKWFFHTHTELSMGMELKSFSRGNTEIMAEDTMVN
ncbi:hypothetical protein CDAR_576701 [Caerostris darwini]|uniref:Uncharacterized protein n=1 Tax=Caerostris darwini TaxID=1538125 RepID=A0AAV4W2G1_9ARAC|nr:hypothetical protein CDAR_576701 [Caerostris darwini]